MAAVEASMFLVSLTFLMLARGFIRLVPIGCGAPGVLGGIRLPDWDVVRGGPVAQARSIVVLHPTSYRESKVVGEHLRDGDVVLLDLTRLDGDDMHRLVDFVSGLVFGLQGNIDKVTAYVMLLVPPGVTAIDDESHLTGSFYNQS